MNVESNGPTFTFVCKDFQDKKKGFCLGKNHIALRVQQYYSSYTIMVSIANVVITFKT